MSDILQTMPHAVAVADYVLQKEILRFDLRSIIANGVLTVISINEEENLLYINLAASLDDGEAITGAIAVNRNWAIGTDERKAISVLTNMAPQLQIISTLELIKHWADVTNQPISKVREVLANVQKQASYTPNHKHALYNWWQKFMDP